MADDPVPENIKAISGLRNDFHGAGVLDKEVILEIYKLTRGKQVLNSVETGSGKSTLLFSAISSSHKCFTLGNSDNEDAGSLTAVQNSPLFAGDNVEFILGPAQKTLPAYSFTHPLQLVFIDGPHGYPFPDMEYYFLNPHLEEDGLLILDDIHIPTIARLYEFLREDAMFQHLGNIITTAFFRRNSSSLFNPYGDGWWLQNFNKKRFAALHARYYSPKFSSRIYQLISRIFGARFAEKARRLYRRRNS